MQNELALSAVGISHCSRKNRTESLFSDAIRTWYQTESLSVDSSSKRQDPLERFKEMAERVDFDPSIRSSICKECRKAMKIVLRRVREYLWEELPVYFGIREERIYLTNWETFW